jgi:hypothetical protein
VAEKSPEAERAERAAKASTRAQRYSLRIQHRFDFYIVALTFTLLGLSVQTARFCSSRWSNGLELVGWLAFLGSALVGLWRLEKIPGYFLKVAEYVDWPTLPESRVAVVTDMGQLDRKLKRLYVLQKWAFLTGLFQVLLARGLPRAADLFGYVLR